MMSLAPLGDGKVHSVYFPAGSVVEPNARSLDVVSCVAAFAPELDRVCMQELEDSSDGMPKHLHCTGLYSDIEHKKQTLPVLYAVEQAGPEDRERLLELYAKPSPTPGAGCRPWS